MPDDGSSLLDVLRDQLGLRSREGRLQPPGPVRLLHGARRRRARVACVTPARRVAGRAITTARRARPRRRRRAGPTRSSPPAAASAASARRASSMRLEGLRAKGGRAERPRRGRAGAPGPPVPLHRLADDRSRPSTRRPESPWSSAVAPGRLRFGDLEAAARRATHRGRGAAAGRPRRGARPGRLRRRHRARRRAGRRARRSGRLGGGRDAAEARRAAGKVQGRRTTAEPSRRSRCPPATGP